LIILFAWFPLSAQNPSMSEFYPWAVLAGFFLFDICAYISLAALRSKLITSPWGIEYYDMGIKMRAPWKSVVGIEKLRYVYKWVDSLVTTQQAEMSRFILASLITSKHRHLPASDMDIDKIRRSIPIGNFVSDWRDSSLGEEIRRYAPQVFGGKDEQEASSLTGTARTRGLDTAGNQEKIGVDHSTSDVAVAAFPTTHRGDKTRRGLWNKWTPLAIVVVEVLFAFFVAPSIYRSAQPLLGAANPLPGQLFLKGAYGPSDLSRNGQFLAAGGQVVTFPEGKHKLKVTLPPRRDDNSQMIESIALSADGKLVAAGDRYGNAFIWQVDDGHLMQTLSVTQPIMILDSVAGRTTMGNVYSVAFSPDGRKLAAIGPTGQIKVWNPDDGTLLSTMNSSHNTARLGASAKLLFDPSGQRLVSLIEGTLEMWRAQDGSLVGKVDPGEWVEDVAMSADGETLALGTLYGGIYLWNVRSGSVSKTLKEWKKKGSSHEAIYGIAISPDGKTVVSGSSLGGMQMWSVDGGDPKNMQDASGTTVRWMTFSPDGSKLIYSKYYDHSIWVWANGPGTAQQVIEPERK
jgi:WD40 repeat protein